jgi:hypothetical protein
MEKTLALPELTKLGPSHRIGHKLVYIAFQSNKCLRECRTTRMRRVSIQSHALIAAMASVMYLSEI